MSTSSPIQFFEDVGHRIGLALAAQVMIAAPKVQQATRPARRAAHAASGGALRAAKRVRDGATVWYRQGRGAFEATVLRAKHPSGMVLLQRARDLKRVLRPPNRVYVAR